MGYSDYDYKREFVSSELDSKDYRFLLLQEFLDETGDTSDISTIPDDELREIEDEIKRRLREGWYN